MIKVISLGGSIVAPEMPDVEFLKHFSQLVRNYLSDDSTRKLIFVTGGGGPARTYQKAYRDIAGLTQNEQADWIGIMATRLNAQLMKAVFSDICPCDVVYNPTETGIFAGKVLIAAGWKPGFSSDNDAVLLAERFSADTVINLSNIEKVYTDDPKINPDAKPIDNMSWADFRKMIGDEWIPGKNVPFDPVASRHAENSGIKVICASGRNLENLKNILEDKPFIGTIIS